MLRQLSLAVVTLCFAAAGVASAQPLAARSPRTP